MTTLSVGTTVSINGSSQESPVQCFWNGSNDTVHVELNSTAAIPVALTVTVTALGEGSGELYCTSTCTGLGVDNMTNSIFLNVTGEQALCSIAHFLFRSAQSLTSYGMLTLCISSSRFNHSPSHPSESVEVQTPTTSSTATDTMTVGKCMGPCSSHTYSVLVLLRCSSQSDKCW